MISSLASSNSFAQLAPLVGSAPVDNELDPLTNSSPELNAKSDGGAFDSSSDVGVGGAEKSKKGFFRALKKAEQKELPGRNLQSSLPSQDSQIPSHVAHPQAQSHLSGPAQQPSEAQGTGESNANSSPAFAVPARQAVLAKFMTQMQSQLGVRPEQLVQAMAALQPQELMRSPEETMNLVLNQLEIPMQDRSEAEFLYKKMLSESAQLPPNPALSPPSPQLSPQLSPQINSTHLPLTDRWQPGPGNQMLKSQPSIEVLTLDQQQQRQLAKGLDGLNEAFYGNQASPQNLKTAFAQNAASGSAQGAELTEPLSFTEQAQLAQTQLRDLQQALKEYQEAKAQQRSEPDGASAELTAIAGTAADAADVASSSAAPAPPSPPALSDSLASASLDTRTPASEFFTNSNASSGAESAAIGAAPPAPLAASDHKSDRGGEETKHHAKDQGPEGRDELSARAQAKGPEHLAELGAATGTKPTALTESSSPSGSLAIAGAAAGAPTRSEQIKNIQEIMAKAEVLVNQGGGEVKVHLNPEGLGQLTLKVSVQDGQVALQMMTESHEAKRALESSLGDLKSHLAQNKLNLEQVKVNVGSQPSSDMGQDLQRRQQEMMQDMSREFARGFLSNFRDERGERNGNFADLAHNRGYSGSRSGKSRISDAPAIEAVSGARGRTNKRLDVVA